MVVNDGMSTNLRERLRAIESAVDRNTYRAGPWAAAVREARCLPRAERATLTEEFTRVSDKLHRRGGRRTWTLAFGIGQEIAFTIGALALVAIGLKMESNLATMSAAVILTVTLEPLIKVATGRALGVGYSYVYLRGIEPRFKMRYGTYLVAPRWRRIVLHISGMVGSPLAFLLVARLAAGRLPVSESLCKVLFWVLLAPQVVPLLAGLAGLKRLGPLPVSASSGGAAGDEMREWMS